jgi:hypothetical protein
MTQNEHDLLLLLATIFGPSHPQWREIRDLVAKIREEASHAN